MDHSEEAVPQTTKRNPRSTPPSSTRTWCFATQAMWRRADAATASATRSAFAARRSLAVPSTTASLSHSSSRLHRSQRSKFTAPRRRSPRGMLALCLGRGSLRSLRNSRRACGGRKSRSVSTVVFTPPPEELEEGHFERPTPLLLVAGEGQPATW